jgi:hypothetical protein
MSKQHDEFQGSLSIAETKMLREAGFLPGAIELGFIPVLAGGVTSYADAITNPLSAPTISTTTFTVDFLLDNPTRVTRMVADLVMRNFFLDKVFTMGGEVTGGAVLYDQATTIDVYTDRDVERVQPGAEFPIVTGARIAPLVAAVEKFGGKFPVTDEAKRRNETSRVVNQMRRLANTITRKMQQRGISELEAAITASSRTISSGFTKWSTSVAAEWSKTKREENPAAVFMKAIEENENNEMGYSFDTVIMNPGDAFLLREYYGTDGSLKTGLADWGIDTLVVTPRKAAKSVIVLAKNVVGEMRLESPMRTVTEREGAPDMREQTWIQTAVNPVFFVTDPFAVVEVTGVS